MTLIKVNNIEASEELTLFDRLSGVFVHRTYHEGLICVSVIKMRRDLCERNEKTRRKIRKIERTLTPKETLLRSSVR